MDFRASRSQQSSRLLVPELVGNSIQCRQLSEAILETIGRDSRSSGCDPPGLSAHLFHAHAESRHRQGHTAPPPAYRSPNHSKALREGYPYELACGCCCSGRTNNRYSGPAQVAARWGSLNSSIEPARTAIVWLGPTAPAIRKRVCKRFSRCLGNIGHLQIARQ